jgi:hypothetical protein
MFSLSLLNSGIASMDSIGRPAPVLIGALQYFGLGHINAGEKEDLRALILRGGPWSAEERTAILNYCAEDVAALERLLPAMPPHLDLPRALLRGRFMKAAAAMEYNGVPIDMVTLELLRAHWTDIQDELIRQIDADYGVFEGRTFKADRWAHYLAMHGIPWPGWRAAASISATMPSGRWPRHTPWCRRCGSCAARYQSCA